MKDTYFALNDGLFPGGYETESFKANGFYGYDDFCEFGLRIGLAESARQAYWMLSDRNAPLYTG